MSRFLLLAILPLLAACAGQQSLPRPATTTKQCRMAPNGAPPIADRGIGGTGVTPAPLMESDRGIGGTGVVGVVTGFASICVDGAEVAYDASTPVAVDGASADADVLRAGQVVAINATGPQDRLFAREMHVHHQVIGLVEAIVTVGTTYTVAGQQVVLDGPVMGGDYLKPGNWVAVSGLLGPAGAIHATRIDPSPAGDALVRGVLRRADAGWEIGRLHLQLSADQSARAGDRVTASGRYLAGTLMVEHLEPDLLISNPPAYFGADTTRYLVESYVTFGADRIRLEGGFEVPAGSVAMTEAPPMRAIMSLQGTPSGGLLVTGIGRPGSPVIPIIGGQGGASGSVPLPSPGEASAPPLRGTPGIGAPAGIRGPNVPGGLGPAPPVLNVPGGLGPVPGLGHR